MTLYPVSTGRATELLVQQRLQGHVGRDRSILLNLQQQVSTGRRLILPSDDPSAAVRGIGIQHVLEQKRQVQVNVTTSQSFLTSSEATIAGIGNLLGEIRGTAINVVDTTSTEVQREAASRDIEQTITQLFDIANRTFRDRYLFSGSINGKPPFELQEGNVLFNGAEHELNSLAGDDLLFPTNISASEVFGVLSPEPVISTDLNPVLTQETRLSDLRGGRGVSSGSITISDGANSQKVDLSRAKTVGNVLDLLEAGAPEGRTITARLSEGRIVVSIDADGGGNLTVADFGGDKLAKQLGIESTSGVGTGDIVGDDLNPQLRKTTRLDDIFGSRASAFLNVAGASNDVVIEARDRGAEYNDYHFQIVDSSLLQASGAIIAGNETATLSETPVASRAAVTFSGAGNNLVLTAAAAGAEYNNVEIEIVDAGAIGDAAQVTFNSSERRLQIGIDSTSATTVQTVIDAVNAEGTFTASYDASEPGDGPFNPAAVINAADANVVAGNTGNSGGDANTVFITVASGSTTANQVIDAVQANASIDELFVTSISSPDSASINSGGKGTAVASTATTSGGGGIEFDQDSGIQISNGGVTRTIDFSNAVSVEDLLNEINGAGVFVEARLNNQKNGIEIRSVLAGGDLFVGENGGDTATQLGIRSLGLQSQLDDLNHGRGVDTQEGADFVITRGDGIELEIDVEGAVTIEDVLERINDHADNVAGASQVVASLAEFGNGIVITSDNPTVGNQLAITRSLGSEAAWDLGLLPQGVDALNPDAANQATPASATVAFANPNDTNTGFVITANSPGAGLNDVEVEFVDSLAGDTATASFAAGRLTIQIDRTQTTTQTIIAAIQTEGTFGAALDTSVDPSNDGSGTPDAVGVVGITSGGTADSITGSDVNPHEVKGAFNSLIRLNEALINFDLREISRATQALEEDITRVSFARADLGIRLQSLDILEERTVTETIELEATLSEEIDADLVETITDLTARQAAFEASLQMAGRTFQLTLLNYI